MALASHETEIRVRYQETDGQRRVHHANFLTYFEIGRTEMLRARGATYREFEEAGLFLVVSEAACKYRSPAEYDDLRRKGRRCEHRAWLRGDPRQGDHRQREDGGRLRRSRGAGAAAPRLAAGMNPPAESRRTLSRAARTRTAARRTGIARAPVTSRGPRSSPRGRSSRGSRSSSRWPWPAPRHATG